MYLDDIDPSTLTTDQKQALTDLFDSDPYSFYELFRDPDAIQRQLEGSDFETTSIDELYKKLGALKLAGAPESVIRWWQTILEHHNRPTEPNMLGLTPRTNVVPEKMRQIENFCKHIDEELNYIRRNRDDTTDDFPDEVPFAQKWQNAMSMAMGEPAAEEIHIGTVRHYKGTDPILASSGTEIVEVTLTGHQTEFDMESYADDVFDDVIEDHISPYAIQVIRRENGVVVRFKFADIYE